MKNRDREPSSKGWQLLLIAIIFIIVLFVLCYNAFGVVVYPTFTYDSEDATVGKFKIYSNTTGDSLTAGNLVEVNRGILTIWRGTTSVTELGPVTVLGYLISGTDTVKSTYVLNTATQAILDSLNVVLDSLRDLENWIAHQTTADSILDTSGIIYTSVDAIRDSAQFLTTATSVIVSDKTGFMLAASGLDADTSFSQVQMAVNAIRDTAQHLVTATQLSSLGFRLDSADFTNSTFPYWLFTAGYFDSTQGSASGLTANDVWNVAFNTGFTTGSMGDSLTNGSYVQGSASGLTASEILDSIYLRDSLIFANGYWHKIANRSDSGATAAIPDSTLGDVSYIANNQGDFKANVSGLSTFDYTTDSVLTSNLGQVAQRNADSAYAKFISGTNEDQFKSDVSGLSTYNVSTDSVLLKNRAQIASQVADSTGSVTASVDYDSIKGAIWSDTQSNYTTAGTFGYNLDVAVSSIAGLSGNGAYTISLVVIDSGSATDSVVSGAIVYVNNYAQNTTPYQSRTNNNGVVTFNLDAGNWVRFTTEPGFAPNLDSFTVSGAVTETLFIYFDAGSMTSIAWQLDKPNGQPYPNAKIFVDLQQSYPNDSILKIADTTIPAHSQREIEFTSDANGLLSFNLYPNDTLNGIEGDSTWYKIRTQDNKGRYIMPTFYVYVPTSDTTVWMHNLIRWGSL